MLEVVGIIGIPVLAVAVLLWIIVAVVMILDKVGSGG